MPHKCESCDELVDDFILCATCDFKKLCVICSGAHYRSKATSDHVLLTSCNNHIHECISHQMISMYWCYACKSALCFKCFTECGTCRHEAKVSIDSKISSIRQDIHSTIAFHEDIIKRYHQDKHNYKDVVENAIEDINEKIDNIINEIINIKNEAIESIKKKFLVCKQSDAIGMAEGILQTAQKYLDYKDYLNPEIDMEDLKCQITELPNINCNDFDLPLPVSYLRLIDYMEDYFSGGNDFTGRRLTSTTIATTVSGDDPNFDFETDSIYVDVDEYWPSIDSINLPTDITAAPDKIALGRCSLYTADPTPGGHSLNQYDLSGNFVASTHFKHKDIRCMCSHGNSLIIATRNNLWVMNVTDMNSASESLLKKNIRVPCIASNNQNVVLFDKDKAEILLLRSDLSVKISVNIGFKISSGCIAITHSGNIWTLQEKDIHLGNAGRILFKYSSELAQLAMGERFSRSATLGSGSQIIAVLDKRTINIYGDQTSNLPRQIKAEGISSIINFEAIGYIAISKRSLKFVPLGDLSPNT